MNHHYTTPSNRLAAKALLTGGRWGSVYSVYRTLEAYTGSITDSNATLAEVTGLSTEHFRRCLKLLERLGLLLAVYDANADLATRRLVVAKQLSPMAIRLLKRLEAGTATLDFHRTQVVLDDGRVVDCSTGTCEMLEGGPVAFELPDSEAARPWVLADFATGAAKCGPLELPLGGDLPTGGASATKGDWGFSSSVSMLDQSDCSGLSVDTELQPSPYTPSPQRKPRAPRGRSFSSWPAERQQAVTYLLNLWQQLFDYPRSKHNDTRRGKVNARLDDGYTVAELEAVLRTAAKDPFWRGKNDRNTPYDDIATLFRNESRVDQFLAKARRGPAVDRLRTDLAASSAPLEEELL